MSKNNTTIIMILLLVTSSILVVISSNKTIITLGEVKKKHPHHPTTKASNGSTARTIPPPPLSSLPSQLSQPASNIVGSNNSAKVVMINFDDGWKSQYLYAKPILDQYGFKASFFIPCAKMQTVRQSYQLAADYLQAREGRIR